MSQETSPLSEEASTALTAYHAMSDSKNAYFQHMQMIDEKYKDGGNANEEEEKVLGDLLLAHDQCVTAFNSAMEKVIDANDRLALIKQMQ